MFNLIFCIIFNHTNRGDFMETNEKLMLTAEDVAEILQVKPSRAYSIIRQMNTELAAMGKLVIRGRVNRRYFEQKISI